MAIVALRQIEDFIELSILIVFPRPGVLHSIDEALHYRG
jgi:hypothetical protein